MIILIIMFLRIFDFLANAIKKEPFFDQFNHYYLLLLLLIFKNYSFLDMYQIILDKYF